MASREQLLRSALAELIRVDARELSLTLAFSEQGVDSLIGLRFSRKIQDLLGEEVEVEWLFDHPSIRQLSAFLDQRFGSVDSNLAPSVLQQQEDSQHMN